MDAQTPARSALGRAKFGGGTGTLVAALGVALFVTTLFVDLTLTLDNALLGIILVAMLTFGVNYLVVRRRER